MTATPTETKQTAAASAAANTAKYIFDKDFTVGAIDDKVWSSFTEHLGRSIYEGIYDPGKPYSDEKGFRNDVKQVVKDLNLGVIRYPGGNFVSNYDWKDGIGPKSERRKTMEFAWSSIETNQFGIDDFCQWCEEVGVEPMIAVNLGTGTIRSAAELVEYCNHDSGTYWSDLRIKNGHREPYHVKYWCLGNEMEGSWQAGHLSAEDYAKKAREAAKMMKWVDQDIKLVVCGTSYEMLPEYLDWDISVLRELYRYVDYVSTHYYTMQSKDISDVDFLASWKELDNHINNTRHAIQLSKDKLHETKDVKICLDEWNVWNFQDIKMDSMEDLNGKTTFELTSAGKWEEHPPILQEKYSLLDALTVGGLGLSILNNVDIVSIACLAQLINVIAPITTDEDGNLLKQTIFYPFADLTRYGRGTVLKGVFSGGTQNTRMGELPTVVAAAVSDEQAGQIRVFALNSDLSAPASFAPEFRGFDGAAPKLVKHEVLTGPDLKARNTFEHPDTVVPAELPVAGADGAGSVGAGAVELPAASWNVLIYEI
ncbi:alpha-N-arabinofuranosidase [Bifidobacterium simiarum]|uniref:non-reducing end alpha-L-arabinofuranosidase n=1 Tax=Bifidobacterium simiarum TaxID=2045441 RepID=A0A2M9HGC5_9BIFI|nr:alpha-L-arabinofuranosidase C-terminal domain-containing protein [Bifidobacterium simiarum]PJM75880.1 alpha-N-arabinofuranosidase [Bifidobacterium simiarum]